MDIDLEYIDNKIVCIHMVKVNMDVDLVWINASFDGAFRYVHYYDILKLLLR